MNKRLMDLISKSVAAKGNHLFKYEIPVIVDAIGHKYHDDEAKEAGLSSKEFDDLIYELDQERLLELVQEEIERTHPDTGMIIGIEPDIYVIDNRKLQRYYNKNLSKYQSLNRKIKASDLLSEVLEIKASLEKLDKKRVSEYNYVLSNIIDDLLIGSEFISTEHRELNAQVFKIREEIIKFKKMLKKLT